MDKTILRDLSYGMYIVGAKSEKDVGCVANTVMQITNDPMTIAVSINHDNYTNKAIKESKRFSVSILGEKTNPEIIGTFGYKSSVDINKYENIEYFELEGMKVLKNACSAIVCEVIDTMETSTHTVFLGKIVAMEKVTEDIPMTYKYYHEVLKGKSPEKAPTYIKEEVKESMEVAKWKCKICGYVVEAENLPEDYVCPICGRPVSDFERV